MSNLTNNTTELNKILAAVNALPDAGSSAEDLTAEIEAQAALIEEQAEQIDELLTVLDGKAAGGSGALETCTLRVVGVEQETGAGAGVTGTGAVMSITYPTLASDGNIEWVSNYFDEPKTLVELENVVVNEVLWLMLTSTNEMYSGYVTEKENAEMIATEMEYGIAYLKCKTPNATSVITVEAGY